MLTQALFLLTPGIAQLFMGDEYFSTLPFARAPSALDLAQAGVYRDDAWVEKGAKNGFFELTRRLLSLRQTNKVWMGAECEVVVLGLCAHRVLHERGPEGAGVQCEDDKHECDRCDQSGGKGHRGGVSVWACDDE